jgi:hypothetical protein
LAFFLAATGVALALSPDREDVSKAHWFFGAAFLLALGRTIHLVSTWKETTSLRYGLSFVLFGAIGLGWIVVYDWVNGKVHKLDTIAQAPKSNPLTDKLPDNPSTPETKPLATKTKPPAKRLEPALPVSPIRWEQRPLQPDSEGRQRILVLIDSSVPMRRPGLIVVCDKPILIGNVSSSGGFLMSTGRMPTAQENVFMFGVSAPEVIEPGIQLEVVLSATEALHVKSVEQLLVQPIPKR